MVVCLTQTRFGPQPDHSTKEDEMYIKTMLMAASSLWAAALMSPADDEQLDVIELEGNLADAVKPPEVAAGKYPGEIQGVEAKASDKGNRYWAVKVVIAPEDLPEAVREHYEDGAVLYWNRQMRPKDAADRRTIFNLKQFYTNLGLDPNITTIDPNDWMGCKTLVTVRQKMWDGEMRAEIASLAPLDKAPARTTRKAAEEEKPSKARGRR